MNIVLPAPKHTGKISLEECLARRRSVREFSDRLLTEDQIGQLLWAGQGITSSEGLRTAPSAGALYGLEIYVVLAAGLFHYGPEVHQLEPRATTDLRASLCRAAWEQQAVRSAPAVFVIVGNHKRLAEKYGDARSPRYVHLEAGHAAQNLLLQAEALGLAGVPVGAFDDHAVHAVLSLPREEQPLYLIPLGHGSARQP